MTKRTRTQSMRECRGLPRFGVAAHKAAVERFGKSAATKDGLQPICKPCDKAYQDAWREQKHSGHWPTPEDIAAAALENRKTFGAVRRTKDEGVLTPKDGTETQREEGEAFERELERVGPETEEGQAMMREAAERSAAARREARNARRRELRRLAKEAEKEVA